MLRERIDKMTSELETYSDIDKLKLDADAKKKVHFAIAALTFWLLFKTSVICIAVYTFVVFFTVCAHKI